MKGYPKDILLCVRDFLEEKLDLEKEIGESEEGQDEFMYELAVGILNEVIKDTKGETK